MSIWKLQVIPGVSIEIPTGGTETGGQAWGHSDGRLPILGDGDGHPRAVGDGDILRGRCHKERVRDGGGGPGEEAIDLEKYQKITKKTW